LVRLLKEAGLAQFLQPLCCAVRLGSSGGERAGSVVASAAAVAALQPEALAAAGLRPGHVRKLARALAAEQAAAAEADAAASSKAAAAATTEFARLTATAQEDDESLDGTAAELEVRPTTSIRFVVAVCWKTPGMRVR